MTDHTSARRRTVVSDAAADVVMQGRSTVARGYVSDAHRLRNRAQARSTEIAAAVRRLDVEPDPVARQRILAWIGAEYDARGGGVLLGLFARCWLGSPYVDHVLTLSGFICEHFTAVDSPPGPYAGARALAGNDAYEYIEVYGDGAVIPIRSDGRSAV